jgi:hypothetical protein
MKHNASVQTLSSQMQGTYGVSLRLVSSQAIRPWMKLDEKTPETRAFKQKVFAMIIDAIKTDSNPFTKEVWGDDHEYGLTYPVVCDMIKFVRTGRGPKAHQTIKPRFRLSLSEVELLDWMRKRALDACDTETKKNAVVALYRKIRGV